MADVPVLPLVSLCAGGGGLDEGLALGAAPGAVRPVLHVEREAFAVAYLVAEMEARGIPAPPSWSSVGALPPRVLGSLRRLSSQCAVGLSAGFPCQPWSQSGRREGIRDARWLWPAIDRAVRRVRPALIFLENVPGLTRGGIEYVLQTLAVVGLAAEWGVFRASAVGSPQKRERLFLLAVDDAGREWLALAMADTDHHGRDRREGFRRRQSAACRSGAALADAVDQGRQRRPQFDDGESVAIVSPGSHVVGRDPSMDHAHGVGRRRLGDPDVPARKAGSALDAWRELGLPDWPPPPDDAQGWRAVLERFPELNPSLDAAASQSVVRRLADGLALPGASRVDWIRILGNGVVPEQAALAFRVLAERLLS